MKPVSDVNLPQRLPNHSFESYLDLGKSYIPGRPHTHDYYEILYCQKNCGAEFAVGGEHYQLQRGDILLISPHTPHGFLSYSKNGESYAGYMLLVSQDYIQRISEQAESFRIDHSQKSKCIRTKGTLWEQVDGLFRTTLEESEMKAPGWETAMYGAFLLLMIQISRAAASNPNTADNSEKPELLTGILAYVENHLSEKITLEDMASRFFVSSSTITHLFNKKMNISFYKYVMQRRLTEAKNLMAEGMPMEKIAVRVGFGDYSAFYRAFKQEFGVSPRQYTKHNGGKNL